MAQNIEGLATEKEARDVAESARESEWAGPSFVRELFLGRFRLDLIHPHPPLAGEAGVGGGGRARASRGSFSGGPSPPTLPPPPPPITTPEEDARARPFFDKLRAFLQRVDSDMIDRTGEIPEEYVQELRDMGAFGIKVPREYGGLGLSYASYAKAIEMVTSKDGSLTALLSASQSIGVPQPLTLFGTEEQKRKYFPRIAKGAITAFALTEVDAGSDPANMVTTATPTPDGKYFVINGEKLWCTNGTRSEEHTSELQSRQYLVCRL